MDHPHLCMGPLPDSCRLVDEKKKKTVENGGYSTFIAGHYYTVYFDQYLEVFSPKMYKFVVKSIYLQFMLMIFSRSK